MEDLERRALEAYTKAVQAEMEEDIYRRTLQKVAVITRVMQEAEKETYLHSRSFEQALSQTRRKDRVYQALERGEMPEHYLVDYDRIHALVVQEIRNGHPLDLPFLRTVAKTRQSLRTAYLARQCLEEGRVTAFLKKQGGKITVEVDGLVAAYLTRWDFSSQFREGEHEESETAVDRLMHDMFSEGVTQRTVDAAVREADFRQYLMEKIYREYPALRSCGAIPVGGETVRTRTMQAAAEESEVLISSISARFSKKRIRRLLRENPSVKALEARQAAERASQKHLKEALIRAMPEHFKDLYPMARRMHRRFVLHFGPTNSGKTWESMQRLQAARDGIYLGPLRLLAFEQFESLNLSDVPTSLITGEEQILVPQSRVQSSTIEMADLHKHYDIAVIDECQMISDRDRGGAWSAAILGLCADEIHVCASPDAEWLLCSIIEECEDEMRIIRHERKAPLVIEEGGFQFPQSVRQGDALIVFAKARVHALAAELKRLGHEVSLIYGTLPPDVRRDQAERFRRGETDVVVSTDAIAMGMNLPIARVVFMEPEKYDGDITRPLTDSEIRQIAGRAGRYGQYDVGYVNAYGFKQVVAQALSRPYRPLTHAVIRFPESLLGLPLPLTEIINRWISMKDKGYFSKASTMRMAGLAGRMETRTTDKQLLYDFLCIPFDETDPTLLSEWKSMYHAEATGTHYDVLQVLPEYRDPEQCRVTMLDRLEEDYRLCDLYYNYTRRFLENPEKLLTEIQLRKDLISAGIIHVLSTQKLLMRTCRKCGRNLPWNWPYTICDHCHRSRAYRGSEEGVWDEDV